jgi:aspartate/methionine/tyrosine aminotransferase
VVDPGDIALTASTSEAYAWLFKLLCDPGDAVLIPRPSYPLFEHLTRLEGVRVDTYDLEYHGRWEIGPRALGPDAPRVRAVIVVSPNNPTGSYISSSDFRRVCEFCRSRQCALIVDEVFADYPLETEHAMTDLAFRADVLTFSLGGLSKSLGLPQVKLGWIAVGGPHDERRQAMSALELIADSFLSVGTPVQVAAERLLESGAPTRGAIHTRVQRNLAALRRISAAHPACDVLRAEGGWSAVVRIPATLGEEEFVIDLLERERVLVHPGYFFDFASEAFVVVSLLPPEDAFGDGVARLLGRASA